MVPPAKVDEVAAKLKDADGLLIVHLSDHGGDAPVLSKLIDVGLPTAAFSQPFSGHGWMYFPQWHKQGKKVILLPSSDWGELDGGRRPVARPGLDEADADPRRRRTARHRRRLLGRADQEEARRRPGDHPQRAGAGRRCKAIDPKAAEAEAQDTGSARPGEIVEPTRPEIIESAAHVPGDQEHHDPARRPRPICSVHCMGNPRGCLTFSKLNDQGLVGGCEGDIDSTLTMLLFSYAFRVPGFISDPVIDTAKNALVHFHCTSATKMDGPCGKRLPFRIRTQTDSRGGVALEVEHRVGQPVTCAKLVEPGHDADGDGQDPRDQHAARWPAARSSPRACPTRGGCSSTGAPA